MAYIVGIDLGAGATKTVIIDEHRNILGRGAARTQADFDAVAKNSLDAACNQAEIERADIDYIAATGLGRYSFTGRDIQITDMTCAARGAYALFPQVQFVLDMGAQCTRAIALRDNGKVKVHRMVLALDCGHAVNPDQIAAQVDVTVAVALHQEGACR